MTKSVGYGFKTPSNYKHSDGLLPTYKHLGVAFLSTSTTHGVPQVFFAKGKCKTIFWLMWILCCLTALGWNLSMLVTKYLQFLPSTRINVYNNRTLPFPAVTICNTNPIKSSAIAHSPRLVALLESWGVIDDSTITTRRKRRTLAKGDLGALPPNNYHTGHHISKRTVKEECTFEELYQASAGYRSDCEPSSTRYTGLNEHDCFTMACDMVKQGAEGYNVLNFLDGGTCRLKVCPLPLVADNLALGSASKGKYIYGMSINNCFSEPCIHGTCTNTESGYTCTCNSGYEGTNCETEINSCLSEPCIHGQCTNTASGYTCGCDPGYEGNNCETEINECDSTPCQNGGSCTDLVNSYTCGCPVDVYGDDCSLECNIDHQCLHGGTCSYNSIELFCFCTSDCTGQNCETCVDPVTTQSPTSTVAKTTTVEESTTHEQTTTVQYTTSYEESTAVHYTTTYEDSTTVQYTSIHEDSTTVQYITTKLEGTTVGHTTTNFETTKVEMTTKNGDTTTFQFTTASDKSTINQYTTSDYKTTRTADTTTQLDPTETQQGVTVDVETPSTADATLPNPESSTQSSSLSERILTEDFLREEDLITLLAETDTDIKKNLGYSLNDMMIECNYNGVDCSESNFSWFFNAMHGNCYVFNSGWNNLEISKQLEAKQQGDHSGLSVILDIGQHEYIQDVGESAGTVVVVHNADKMPFPQDEGILALPGRMTNVAVRRVDMDRLPKPHGDCVEDMDRNRSRSLYEDLYPVKYSVGSCYITCYQKHMVETCRCGDPQYPIEGQVFAGIVIIPCNIRNQSQDACKRRVTEMYIKDELDCECPNPCQLTSFEYKVSSADWPSQVNEPTFLASMTNKRLSNGGPEPNVSILKKNLLKVQVFYETLSYETLLEYPSYRLAKLFWDIGGILGLWLGCSILSIVELLELVCDAVVLLCCKIIKRKHKVLSGNGDHPSSGLMVYNGCIAFDDIPNFDKHITVKKKLAYSNRPICERSSHIQQNNHEQLMSKVTRNSIRERHMRSSNENKGNEEAQENTKVFRFIFGNIPTNKDSTL